MHSCHRSCMNNCKGLNLHIRIRKLFPNFEEQAYQSCLNLKGLAAAKICKANTAWIAFTKCAINKTANRFITLFNQTEKYKKDYK